MPTWTPEGWKRSMRVRVNKARKFRDRWKPKGARYALPEHFFRRRIKHYGEDYYEFARRPAPTETGYGVAWERRDGE